jgi:hypothetical protein
MAGRLRLDFSTAPKKQNEADYSDHLSFDDVAARLLAQSESLCHHLLPGGRKQYNEYVCGSIDGGSGESFSVNLKRGVWKDFATGDAGGDLVKLWSDKFRIRPIDALKEAAEWLGMEIAPPQPVPPSRMREKASGGPSGQEWWKGLRASRIWDYRDASGALVAQVMRWNHPETGEKVIRPWDPESQQFQAPEGKRPLFNLHKVAGTDEVIYVEGEKAAEAIDADGWPCVTNMGGAQAVGKTDWSPLIGKNVIIWRDNDRAGVLNQEALVEILRQVGVASVRLVRVPPDKPAKWDAFDATPEERVALLAEARKSRPVVTGRRAIRISDFAANSHHFFGRAPDRKFLVADTVALGVPLLIAGMGGVGKSMLGIDLAIKVACMEPGVLGPSAFGCRIAEFGRAVIFCAEDDLAEVHRRLDALDPTETRRKRGGRLHIIPMPSVGGAFSIVETERGRFVLSDEWKAACDQLASYDDLVLTIIDPLASFVHGSLDQDNALCQFVGSATSALSAETGATTIAFHHMRKASDKSPVITAQDARASIRGGSALVDSHRGAMALWVPPQTETADMAEKVGVPNHPGSIVFGAMIKTNLPVDTSTKIYVRDPSNGLLQERTAIFSRERIEAAEGTTLKAMVVDAIRLAAISGKPYMKTGAHGLSDERRHELPEGRPGKNKIVRIINDLLESGELRNCAVGRSRGWLDVPGGPFDIGEGEFIDGSFLNVESDD